MTREELIIKELNERNYTIGVEVGSFRGYYANHILSNWGGVLYMVDVWRELSWDDYTDTSNKSIDDTVWYDAMKSVKNFEDRALMLRMQSNQASKLFADGSLDFVYIDANHKYEYVKEDIELWWPKLKSGGMLSGHDYMHTVDWDNPPFAENGKDKHMYMWQGNDTENMQYVGLFGVYPAVNEFAKQKGYDVFHTDEWLSSWYFFKR